MQNVIIVSKTVANLQSYHDISIFKMATLRYLVFLKFKFLWLVEYEGSVCIGILNFLDIDHPIF